MARVIIEVSGLRSDDGQLIAGVYRETDFKRFGGGEAVAKAHAPAASGRLLLKDVPAGRYAVAVYHDENGNGKLDLNFVGVPAEGRGYSNTEHPGLAPPAFEDAAFEHGEDGTWLTISLRYPAKSST